MPSVQTGADLPSLRFEAEHDGTVPVVTLSGPTISGEVSHELLESSTSWTVWTVTRSESATTALDVYVDLGRSHPASYEYSVGATDEGDDIWKVEIPANQTSQSFTIGVVDDSTEEFSERVYVDLVDETTYDVGSPNTGYFDILDDERAIAEITLSGPNTSTLEGNEATTTWTISRGSSETYAQPVYLRITPDSGADLDDLHIGGSIYYLGGSAYYTFIMPGASSTQFTVTVDDDSDVEETERFTMEVTQNLIYTVGTPGAAYLDIIDDDGIEVSVSASDERATEPDEDIAASDTGTFIIELDEAPTSNLTVNFKLLSVDQARVAYPGDPDGTGPLTQDYDLLFGGNPLSLTPDGNGNYNGAVTFIAGQTTKTLVVSPKYDQLTENEEFAYLQIEDGSGYRVSETEGEETVLIADPSSNAPDLKPCTCICVCGPRILAVVPAVNKVDGNVAAENAGSRLTYYSTFASGQETVVAYQTLEPTNGTATLTKVKAELVDFDGAVSSTIWFDGSLAQADTEYAFAFPVDVSAKPTGQYNWEVHITQYYSDDTELDPVSIFGRKKVINTLIGAAATGWFPFGVSSLIRHDNDGTATDHDDVLLMRSGLQRFTWDGSEWIHEEFHDTSAYTLTGDWSTGFTLTAKEGTVDQFELVEADDVAVGARITSTTDNAGNATTYGYMAGKLTSITEPGNETTTFTYDPNTGYVNGMVQPDGVTSTYGHDANGRIVTITKTDPDGSGPLHSPVATLAYYPENGLLKSITYADGGVESYEYDHALRVKKVTHADGTEDSYESFYAAALVDTSSGVGTTDTNLAALIGADDVEVTSTVGGVTTTTDVDRWGFAVVAVDGEGQTTQYERNALGQVTKATSSDPDGAGPLTASITEYAYDDNGNLVLMTLPDGSTRQWEYDSTWNVADQYTDEAGIVTKYTIDSNNGNVLAERVIVGEDDTQGSETDDLVTSYTYTDSGDNTIEGLVETVTDPAGTVTGYEYNARGQTTRITYDSGGALEATVEYEYDSTSGALLAQTDELGRRTEYVYDGLNRKTHTILPAADTTGTTVDNSSATGFTTSGTWTTDGAQIYAEGSAGSADASAIWEFSGLDPDKYYEVFITWSEDVATGATDAPFTVYDGATGPGISLETIDVDQTAAPGGSKLLGSSWHRLGTYALSGSVLSIVLSNDADGRVLADSIRILEHSFTQSVYGSDGRLIETIDEAGRVTGYGYDARGRQTHVYSEAVDASGAVVDDGDADCALSSGWTTDTSRGEEDDLRYAPAGSGAVTAAWTFDNLDPHKRYIVLATWEADAAGNATDAPYSIYDGTTSGTLLDTIDVDQQGRPAILSLFDGNWQSLGSFTPTGDTLTVQLTDDADGRVIADSVRIVEASGVSELVYDVAGDVVATVDFLGNITEYEYDADGRLVKTFAPYADLDGAMQKDDGDTGVLLINTTTVSDPGSVGGDYAQFTASNSYATYRFTEIERNAPYEIWVSYPADSSNVTGAVYSAYNGWTVSPNLIESYTVDQTQPPSGSAVFGDQWHYLGTVSSTDDLLSIKITGGVDVLVDAIMIMEARAVTETVYDDAGRAYQQIDAYGNVTEYVYDTSNRVIQTISPDPDSDGALESSVTRTHYNASGRVGGTIDPVGGVHTLQYDALGRVEATYSGQVIAPTDDAYSETGDIWSDATGGFAGTYRTALAGSTFASATWSFENLMLGEDYDVYVSWTGDYTNGNRFAHFTAYKDTTLVFANYLDQRYDPDQVAGFLEFSEAKFEKLTTISLGATDSTTIRVMLDTLGTSGKLVMADAVYLVRKTAMSESEYDDQGRLASTFDALGNETAYSYDALGWQIDTTLADPDGAGALTSPYLWRHYDAAGQMLATVDPDLRVDSVAYDGRGRVVATYTGQIVDDSTSNSFAATGTWTNATDGGLLDGYTTTDSTDGASPTATATWTFDNLIAGDDYEVYITWKSVTGGADDAPVAIYEGSTAATATWSGTIDQSADPTAGAGLIPFSDLDFVKLGGTITLTDSTLIVQLANNTGETGEVISADAVYVVRKDAMSRSVYDADGMLTASVDADGNETTYTYDALGRVIAVTQPDPDGAGSDYESPITRTYYDSSGQISAIVGPDGRTDTYGYDDLGRQTTTHTGQTITPSHESYEEVTGTWSTAAGGFLGSYQTAATVAGSATVSATWTFTDLVPGEEYEVYVSWTADSGNATDAHFSVYLDSTTGTLVAESDLDQTADPAQAADFAGLGEARFELLTSYLLHENDSTTLVVQLSNDSGTAGNTVAADTVYVVRKGATSESIYDFAGRLVATLDAAGNRTDISYDALGRRTEIVLPDPDGDGPLSRPRTQYVYDRAGRLVETIEYEGDPLEDDQRGAEFQRVLGDSVDIGAYEGLVGPEISTYVVDTLVDESDGDYSAGDLSLREAIELANANSDHDLITFDASLSGTTTLLTGHLAITSDMTIQGPGSNTLTIDADGDENDYRRVFHVSGDTTAIISGLTLTGGYTTIGGAIYNYTGADLTLSDVTITGNHATNHGGGIAGYGKSLVIQDCTITENSAVVHGGGIAAISERVAIHNTTVSSNSVERYGAGISAYYMTLEIVDCTLSDNVFSSDTYSTRYGAGLYLPFGNTTRITGTTIENNKADAMGEYSATHGGGIAGLHEGAELYLSDCTIRNNEALSYGGGVYFYYGSLEIQQTTIEGNEAGTDGGGLYAYVSALTVSDSLFADNLATYGGGMFFYTDTSAMLTGVTVSGNTATNAGGGLYLSANEPSHMVHCTVTENTAATGGGIYMTSSGDLRLDNTIVADNTATSSYPDVRGYFDSHSSNNLIGVDDGLYDGIANGTRGNLVGTSASSIDPMLDDLAYNGGPTKTHMPQAGSPVLDAGSALLTDAYYDGRGEGFSRTVGTGVDIGAVEYNSLNLLVDELTDGAGMTLQEAIAAANANPGHDTITFSAALDLSAAVDINLLAELDVTGDLTILGPGADLLTISGGDSCRIFDLAEGTNVRLVGLALKYGSATGAGGAIRSLADELTLEECEIVSSFATTDGGAIYATGQVNLLESTLAGNSAAEGGAIMLDGGEAFVRQSTIAENSAANGAGIALENSATATILQATIVNNTASANGGGLSISSSNVLMHNTLVADNSAATAYPDVAGALLAESSYNLISSGSGMNGISNGSQGNQVGEGSTIDAMLGDLGYHGGTVQTVPLRVGSPALDAGSDELAVTRLGRSGGSVVYDALGRVVQEIAADPDGIGSEPAPVTTYAYDAAGNLLSQTDANGNTTTYTYDNLGRAVSMVDALDKTWSMTYDAVGRVLTETDPLSNTTTYQYDAFDQVVSVTDAEGGETTAAYDSRGNLVSVTDARDYTTSYTYDALNRVTMITDALGKEWSYAYDSVGNVVSETDPLGHSTQYAYDIYGNLTRITDADGNVTEFSYDVRSNLLSEVDAVGAVTSHAYDALGREISTTDALGSQTFYAYDDYGNLHSIRDALGSTSVFRYDNLGQLTEVRDADGGTTRYAYDPVGNLLSETDPLGRTTSFTYDDLNRRLTTTNPESETTTFTYDDVGNVLTVTDPLNNTTTYEYDDVYRLTRETDDLSGETDYTYDLAGNLLTLTDPEENTTTWTYDALNRVTQETNELSDSYSYDYDDAGNLIRQTNRDGRIIEYDYSDVNLLTEERWIEGTTTVHTITFAYDDVGRMTSASDSDSTVSYVYDLLGQATSITQTIADLGSSVVLGATYDSVGNRVQLAATIGSTADFVNDYTYDRLNRMTQVDQSGTGVAAKRIDFTYDAASQFDTITRYADLAATDLVAVSSYTFDDAGRITDLSHVQGATTLADYDWVYDLAGRVTQFDSATDGTADYTYDDTNQLTAADYDYQTDEAHTYDANGNRTDTGYTTGDANRLLTDGTYTYTYDANGNRTARFVDTDSSGTLNSGDTSITEYTWDHRNRLTNVTDRASYGGAATQTVDYVYDAFNRLVHKEIDADGDGTGTADDTFWIHDGDQAVLQFDGSTAADLSHRYLWGTAVDQLLADETVDDGGAEDVLWPLTDNLGTVRDLATYDDSTDTTTIANHKAYDAFGNVTSETNSAVDTLFGYTGRLFDDDTGLQNNLNRWYDPAVGQWVSEDPIGFAAGDANLSRYVGNNVTGAVDPWGLEDLSTSDDTYWQEYWARYKGKPYTSQQFEEDVRNGAFFGRSAVEVRAIEMAVRARELDAAVTWLQQQLNEMRPQLESMSYLQDRYGTTSHDIAAYEAQITQYERLLGVLNHELKTIKDAFGLNAEEERLSRLLSDMRRQWESMEYLRTTSDFERDFGGYRARMTEAERQLAEVRRQLGACGDLGTTTICAHCPRSTPGAGVPTGTGLEIASAMDHRNIQVNVGPESEGGPEVIIDPITGLGALARLGLKYGLRVLAREGLEAAVRNLGDDAIRAVDGALLDSRAFAQRVSEAESLISRHVIDMTNAPVKSARNALGFQRNGPWFWRQLRNQKEEMFSPANLRRIKQGRSPVVDETWVRHNPQHARYLDDKLVHHHIDQGRFASGIPETIHQELFDLLHRRTLR